jgi:hypothetical protein
MAIIQEKKIPRKNLKENQQGLLLTNVNESNFKNLYFFKNICFVILFLVYENKIK